VKRVFSKVERKYDVPMHWGIDGNERNEERAGPKNLEEEKVEGMVMERREYKLEKDCRMK
jgi:hypothetical protein